MARRVAVTSAQTRLARSRRRPPARPPAPRPISDIARAQHNYRAQRRRAIPTLIILFTVLIGPPVMISLWPALDDIRVWHIPVSWLTLWLLPYPVLAILGCWHLWRAEAVESGAAGDRP
ncbi:hypothetical protein [Nocardia heshunensis]